MTDVLLTHSYHLPFDRKQARKMQPYPPLGTLYAAALLRQSGLSVGLFDPMLTSPDGFAEALEQHRPAIVAVYEDDFNFLSKMCLTRMREVAFEMAEEARSFGARVVVHGSDATDHTLEFLSHGFEYALIGEAEHTLLQTSLAILAGQRVESVAGIAFLDSSGTHVHRTEPRQALRYPSPLPPPARDLVDHDLYRDAWLRAHGRFSLNAISSRGCPFRCNWCAKPIFGDNFRVNPPAQVADEMLELRDRYGADHIWFADDIFGLNRRWVSAFADEVEHRRAQVPFKIQARADLITSEVAVALSRARCEEVWMGVESGSQPVLDAMEKSLRVEDVYIARENLLQVGIRACFFLQFGYPGETWSDIRKTVDLVRRTRPDDIGVSLSYPLPNTRFYQRVRDQLGTKRNWNDSDDLCVMFKGAYTDDFYRLIRDALHLEVEGWSGETESANRAESLWNEIERREQLSRNHDATELPAFHSPGDVFVSLNALSTEAGD
ncbi:MAG: radical SAM protein [Terriglobia bacterium]|nr:radical SAM protein [Terriglobia bacterium]